MRATKKNEAEKWGQRLAGDGQGPLLAAQGRPLRSWRGWGRELGCSLGWHQTGGGNNRCQLLIPECAFVFPEKLEGRELGRMQWWNKVQAVSWVWTTRAKSRLRSTAVGKPFLASLHCLGLGDWKSLGSYDTEGVFEIFHFCGNEHSIQNRIFFF